jgi:hypothetical protein
VKKAEEEICSAIRQQGTERPKHAKDLSWRK